MLIYLSEIIMAKKLKNLVADNNLSSTIRDSAQQIWLAGLGAFAKAQAEGNKVFDALVREGEDIQSKTRRIAEDKVTEMAAKATGTWDKLEQVFENRVAKALNSLGVPTQKDIEALTKRVATLTAEVEKLNATPAAKPVRRTAAAPKVAKAVAPKAPAAPKVAKVAKVAKVTKTEKAAPADAKK
jgi:poly(hydroxyalkanoate) granule-associated protein